MEQMCSTDPFLHLR